jgi:hypothetical protein
MTLHKMSRVTTNTTKLRLCVVVLAVALSSTMLAQETSRVIPYPNVQTTLVDGPAQPLTLEIWDTPAGGTTPRFSETQLLDVNGGQIGFYLGAATPTGLNPADFQSGASRFLDVKDSTGTTVLSARIPLTAAAFALSPGPTGPQGPPGIGTVNSVGSGAGLIGGPITSSGTLSLDTSFLNARYPQLTTPNTYASDQNINGSLNISGNGAAGGTFSANGVIGLSPLGRGVYGRSGGAGPTTAGIFGENTASGGTGVVGSGLNTNSAGVAGVADNPNSTGVYGRGTAYGVFGTSSTGEGGYFSTSSGFGVYASSSTSTGVYASSASGTGIYGRSSTGSSTIAGVWGENSAVAGTGVVGNALNWYSAGVAGIADEIGGTGVYGRGAAAGVSGTGTGTSGGTGVSGDGLSGGIGVSGTSGNGYGVRGNSSTGIGVIGISQNGYAGWFQGKVVVTNLGPTGSTSLCRNGFNEISTCSSSLRYKTDVGPFVGGLDLVNRLRPIAFTWKQDGTRDLGLGAEEVAAVEPLLVTHNDQGQIEGVKYDRLAAVLINAVKEQQAQIDRLQRLLCADHPQAEVCR